MNTGWIIRKQDGSAAVEFAVILPLFLLIVFGIVEWGLYLFNDHIITDASRRGARRGILQASPHISESEIRTTVLTYTGDRLVTFGTMTPPAVDVNVYNPDGTVAHNPDGTVAKNCLVFQDSLEVTASYNYTFLLLPALTFGGVSPSISMTARTVMKCE